MKFKFFLPLSLTILSSFSFFLAIEPGYSQSSCQATVNSVIKEIKRKGVPKVKTRVTPNTYEEYGGGLTNASARNSLDIELSGKASADILNSRILTKNWAILIFKECKGTGYVQFWDGESNEGYQSSSQKFAIKEDGRLFWSKCADNVEEIVNPDSKPMEGADGFCAWVPVTF